MRRLMPNLCGPSSPPTKPYPSLNLGELWAIPIMLRLALIENLRRVTSRLMIARHDRDLADLWVERLQEMAEKKPSHLVVVVADMAQSTLPLSSAFVGEFTQRLSRQSPAMQGVGCAHLRFFRCPLPKNLD